jgi:hypothetical protein
VVNHSSGASQEGLQDFNVDEAEDLDGEGSVYQEYDFEFVPITNGDDSRF